MDVDALTDPLGSAERDGKRFVLSYERHIPRGVDRVWAALTLPALLHEWLGEVEVDPVEGGIFSITWLNANADGRAPTMEARITAIDPPRLLEVRGPPHGVLRFELGPEGDGTILTLTNTTRRRPDDMFRNLAGWHIHLIHLEESLDGATVDWPNWWREEGATRWQTLHDRYRERALAARG